jgi:glucan phosphoethanolaminetransferase (alkaline phosphatase superfamily)
MIQRIQSLYLFVAGLLLTLALFVPWISFFGQEGDLSQLKAFKVEHILGNGAQSYSFWALGALLIIAAALSFVCLFFFKNRPLQSRFCVFNIILLIGFYLVFLIFFIYVRKSLDASPGLNFGLALPLIALILNFMALRAINKDEALVQSYHRLR